MYDDRCVSPPNYGNDNNIYIRIMLYILHLSNIICQLHLNEIGN